EEKEKINELGQEKLYELTPAQIEELIPTYTGELNRLFKKRIVDLANYYKDRLNSWDVVNESATDYGLGRMVPGDKICKSRYGLMPGDYTFESFKTANSAFPSGVLMNINDYKNDEVYANQVLDLLDRGCKIDIMGSQMHLFNPQQCLDIAAGKSIETPEIVWNRMAAISKAGLPIHLSEITITSPGDDEVGREIQAVITRNLYRLWFSIEKMMGITWWNVVDGCGAPGEPTISGLFTRNMEPKPSYYALNKLINEEWKTHKTVKVKEDGTINFRGFKGGYVVTWKDKNGNEQKAEFYLKKDGDGFYSFP
ncbi:MAG: endo-1,4-beta-xylanase, partial [Prolixibacteraceae bacterium]|nr:endo-1,4-beta-xylanase [Prolixibacteraceae bacterium]